MGKLSVLLTAGLGVAGGFVAARRFAWTSDQSNGEETFKQTNQWSAPPEAVQRLVHVARIQGGSEAALRRLLEEHFPVSAMSVPGLHDLGVFIGNAYLLTEYSFSGEFEPIFTAFRAQPAVATYLTELGRLLDDEPAPQPDMAALQILASQALHWDQISGLAFTPRVRAPAASSSTGQPGPSA